MVFFMFVLLDSMPHHRPQPSFDVNQRDLPGSPLTSRTYRSAAWRTTHASETLLASAIRSKSAYTSAGKLMDARTVLDSSFFRLARLVIMVSTQFSPLYTKVVRLGRRSQ
jgi:hypothetical protein